MLICNNFKIIKLLFGTSGKIELAILPFSTIPIGAIPHYIGTVLRFRCKCRYVPLLQ